ncbi:MAG: ABC transporter permease [Bacillus sp. (in: Bacteria)]|nr:ABC transporter permease [Bacillus sp. (in: firmicutes)]
MNILAVLIIVALFISLFSPYFLTINNIMGVSRTISITAIMAIGMTMVIITGGIDLSVGSIMGLSSLLTALMFEQGLPTFVAVTVGVFVGVIAGLINGLLITKVNLPPFIATLGTLSIGRGAIYMITKGFPITPDIPESYSFIGQGYLGFIPLPVIAMVVLMIVFWIIMSRTRFGRHVYAIGGNETAARLSGVKTNKTKIMVYMLSGTISAIAGIILFARLSSAEPASGFGAELEVIAAAAIGGASLAGGYGSIIGAIIGAALIGVISNGIVLLNINTYSQQAITGLVILIAVSIDMWRSKRKG